MDIAYSVPFIFSHRAFYWVHRINSIQFNPKRVVGHILFSYSLSFTSIKMHHLGPHAFLLCDHFRERTAVVAMLLPYSPFFPVGVCGVGGVDGGGEWVI